MLVLMYHSWQGLGDRMWSLEIELGWAECKAGALAAVLAQPRFSSFSAFHIVIICLLSGSTKHISMES